MGVELRLIELVVPTSHESRLDKLLEECTLVDVWRGPADSERLAARVLVELSEAQSVLDAAQDRLGHLEGFRLVMTSIGATLPKLEEPEPPEPEVAAPEEPPKPTYGWKGLTRLELEDKTSAATKLDNHHRAMIVLSVVVASTGLLGSNVAVVIAAMVIAPLLGPNIAFAMATCLGDTTLAHAAARINILGMSMALGLAVALGTVVGADLFTDQVLERCQKPPGTTDFALALAAGAAGALSFTSGVPGTLIGVMVAVALMPPLLVAGFMLGDAFVGGSGPGLHADSSYTYAGNAALLLAANVICVNLAAIVTFTMQGVRPSRWWDADRARRGTRRAMIGWGSVLFLLAIVLVITRQLGK